jgi:outer membrane receptor protein involved in Fe transport
MTLRHAILLAIPLLYPFAAPAADSTNVVDLDRIEVTSDKIPTTLARSPDSVTVVDGDTLRAQGATDLAGAMRLVAGVEAPPGGDNGPASSVPALWGLREFDAFLLVVDGVPSGGAFNPALQALDLANVERIEVLRGAAPVSFGATSFVGVIQVIHYAAGKGPMRAEVHAGSRGSYGFSVTAPVNDGKDGGFASSLMADADRQRMAQDRTGFDRAHVLYRVRGDVGGGTLGMDIDGSVVSQDPGSPHPREGTVLSPRFPLDANVNPADAKLDETRIQLAFDYAHATGLGEWNTKLSLAHTDGENTRGFLRQDFADDGTTHNADGFRQQRHTEEAYFDSHITTELSPRSTLAWGVDYLYGYGAQTSDNFEYGIFPDGRNPPVSINLHTDEITSLNDRRSFAGVYGDWRFDVTDAWRLDGGIRYNHTSEHRYGQAIDNTVSPPELAVADTSQHTSNRFSGVLGSSLQLWKDGNDEIVGYVNYRNAFKPAAIDFGPDVEGGILNPETARSGEFGFKGSNMGGRLQWDASAFLMHFDNLVVSTDVGGEPALANAGSERFRGVEFETKYRLADDLNLQASWAWHDARFEDNVQVIDDVPVQLRGKQLELSPHQLAGLGLTYAPTEGWTSYVIGSYVGSRYLDRLNTAPVGSYTTIDAGIGYRRANWELRLDGTNLSDRRDPVSSSEFGDESFYRLQGRSVMASLRWTFDKAPSKP